jgi:hypothetical protein
MNVEETFVVSTQSRKLGVEIYEKPNGGSVAEI